MPSISVAVLLWAWLALAMGGVAWGGAGEQRWTQYWGQVQAIRSTDVASDRGYAKARWC